MSNLNQYFTETSMPKEHFLDKLRNSLSNKKKYILLSIATLALFSVSGIVYVRYFLSAKTVNNESKQATSFGNILPTQSNFEPTFQPISDQSTSSRSDPNEVNNRVVTALQNDDVQALFNELSPSYQALFSLDSLQKSQAQYTSKLGKVIKVETIEPPKLLTGEQGDSSYADAVLHVTREKGVVDYISRYNLENNQWYLMGTMEK